MQIVYKKEEDLTYLKKVVKVFDPEVEVTFITLKELKVKHKKQPTKGVLLCFDCMQDLKLFGSNKQNKVGENTIIRTDYITAVNATTKKDFLNKLETAHDIETGDYVQEELTIIEINDIETLDECIELTTWSGICAFDYETTSLDIYSDEFGLRILSISPYPRTAYVLNLEEKPTKWHEKIYDYILANDEIIKVAQNMKFDISIIHKYLGDIKGELHDTMLSSFVLNENTSNGLKERVDEYYPNHSGYDIGVDFLGPIDKLIPYAAKDTIFTLGIYFIHREMLLEEPKLQNLYENLNIPVCREVLIPMYDNGVRIDTYKCEKYIEELDSIIEEREDELQNYPEVLRYIGELNRQAAEKEYNRLINLKSQKSKDKAQAIKSYGLEEQITKVNLASPVQLSGLLFTKAGFGITSKDKSTSAENLDSLTTSFGIRLRALRTFIKLRDTYLKSMLAKTNGDILRAGFNQTGTKTGRLSSSEPNLQNLPSRLTFKDDLLAKYIKCVKDVIIPRDGYKLVQYDFSQAELRMIAHIADETTMIETYNSGKDLHVITGAKIAGVTVEQLEADEELYNKFRPVGKTANFGIVYGISAAGYMDYVKTSGRIITKKEAQSHIDAVYSAFPKLSRWHESYKLKARNKGYVSTLFGQRRRFTAQDFRLDEHGVYRKAINSPIQGTVGQLCLWSMYKAKLKYPNVIQVLTVHDSVICEVKDDDNFNENVINYKLALEDFYDDRFITNLKVPMKIDVEVSESSWAKMSKFST